MANLSQGGFWPEHNQSSTTTQTKRVRIVSNNATAIFWGDCLTRTGAGVWGLATAGSGVAGVAQGASYQDTSQFVRKENMFLPAATTYTGAVFDDHGETDQSFVYIVADPLGVRYRCEYSASVPALADMTLNANFVATAGSTASGISGHRLNQATIANTAGLDFAIMDIKHTILNDTTLVAAKVFVQINKNVVPPASAGAVGIP